jgi:ATP-binding cassette subfamily B protein
MLKEYKTLLPYFKKYAFYYIGGFLCLFITDSGVLFIPQILKTVIDAISTGQFALNTVFISMLKIIGVSVIIGLARFWWRFFFHGISFRIEKELRDKLYTHLLTLSSTFYGKTKIGDLMARMTNDMEAIRRASGFSFVALFDGLFMSITILVILFIQNTQLALLTFIPLPFLTLLMLVFSKLIGKHYKSVQEGFSKLTEMVQETLAGIRVVKTFVQEETFQQRFKACNNAYTRSNMALTKVAGLFDPLIGLLAGLTLFFLLVFGGMAVMEGRLTPGELMAFMAYLQMLIWPMLGAGFTINLLQRGATSLNRINSILEQKPDIQSPPGSKNNPDNPCAVSPAGITIKDLTYLYAGTEQAVLSHIELHIPAGRWVGILGRTGAGKSTLAKLLPRLLDPPPGTIFINNRDVRTFNLQELRAMVGMVPQDTFLFSASIFDNIAFGRLEEEKENNREEIKTATEISTITRDLANFPKGWETIIGERGITLSGGQKQRVALARALLVRSRIVILDDAFSAVDTETEDKILKGLQSILKDKTTILISHRISTLKRADCIIVLDKGKIIQQGTHEELLQDKHGFYADIYCTQQLEETIKET